MTDEPLHYCIIPSPIGPLHLSASDAGLCHVGFHGDAGRYAAAHKNPSHPVLRKAAQQFEEYFAGKRRDFDLALDIREGTPFQQDAWQALREIPYGQTRSYREQAVMLGNAKATRAVGAANGRNPLAIVIPCHRVIGADGSLTGFGGGLSIKRELLALEQRFAGRARAQAA